MRKETKSNIYKATVCQIMTKFRQMLGANQMNVLRKNKNR